MIATQKKENGFTLIELLTVIAIIGILSSVVLASLNGARAKSRDARRISDIKQIQLALELYYDANNTYPLDTSSLTPSFISAMPTDPSTLAPYTYQELTNNTANCTLTPCASYVLRAQLETAGHSVFTSSSDVDFSNPPTNTIGFGTGGAVACDDTTNRYFCVQP